MKKIRRKSVKHVKHDILHLKPPKIDKITPIGAVLGFVKHVKQSRLSAVGYFRANCTTVLRVTAALLLPPRIGVTRNINEGKPRVNVPARRNINRRRAVSGVRERL